MALSDESGLTASLRGQLLDQLVAGTLEVRTDALASSTGFPFKVAELPGTLSERSVYDARRRLCDLSYLRTPYQTPTGNIGYRCPGEPASMYVRKGGDVADTVGRACLCNALTADVGLGQTRRDGYSEPALVTLGSDLDGAAALAEKHAHGWSASEVVTWLTAV